MAAASFELLDLLEKRGIMAPHDVEVLREQVAGAQPPPHASFVARRLVQLGYLNSYFAKTLLSEISDKSTNAGHSKISPDQNPQRALQDTAQPDDEEELAKIDASALPELGKFDLLSDDSAKHASLIPGLKPRRGLAALFPRSTHLQLEQPALWQRMLLTSGIVVGLLLFALVIYIVMR
jgi:hypothetical protein